MNSTTHPPVGLGNSLHSQARSLLVEEVLRTVNVSPPDSRNELQGLDAHRAAATVPSLQGTPPSHINHNGGNNDSNNQEGGTGRTNNITQVADNNQEAGNAQIYHDEGNYFMSDCGRVLDASQCRKVAAYYRACRSAWDLHEEASITSPTSSSVSTHHHHLLRSIDPTIHHSRGLTANDANIRGWCQELLKQVLAPHAERMLLLNGGCGDGDDDVSHHGGGYGVRGKGNHVDRTAAAAVVDTEDFHSFILEEGGSSSDGPPSPPPLTPNVDDGEPCETRNSGSGCTTKHADESIITFLITLELGDEDGTYSKDVGGGTTTTEKYCLEVETPTPSSTTAPPTHIITATGNSAVESLPLVVGSAICFFGMLQHSVVIHATANSKAEETTEYGGTSRHQKRGRRLQLVYYTKPARKQQKATTVSSPAVTPTKSVGCAPAPLPLLRGNRRTVVPSSCFYREYENYLSQKHTKAYHYTANKSGSRGGVRGSSSGSSLTFSIPMMPNWCRRVGDRLLQQQQQRRLQYSTGGGQKEVLPQQQQMVVRATTGQVIGESNKNTLDDKDDEVVAVVRSHATTAAVHFTQVAELMTLIVDYTGPYRCSSQIALSEVCSSWNRFLNLHWAELSPVLWEKRREALTQSAALELEVRDARMPSSSGTGTTTTGGGGGGGRQHVTISIGGIGNATASYFWESIAVNAGLDRSGSVLSPSPPLNSSNAVEFDVTDSFLDEYASGQYRPRAVMIDTCNPYLHNPGLEFQNAATSSSSASLSIFERWRSLFHPCQQVFGAGGDTGHVWGGNSVTQQLTDQASDAIRKEVEKCSSFAGFILARGIGGGTCSLTSQLGLSSDYGKTVSTMGATTLPSFKRDRYVQSAVYNSCLALVDEDRHVDVSLLFGNGAMHRAATTTSSSSSSCPYYNPYSHCQIASQVLQSVTAAMRLGGSLNVDVTEMVSNHVPYPRLHYLTTAHAPLMISKQQSRVTSSNTSSEALSTLELSNHVTTPCNFLHMSDDGSGGGGQFMAMSLVFHGNVSPKDVMAAVSTIKTKRSLQFVDWCPTGFKCGINYQPLRCGPSSTPSPQPSPPKASVTSISNTTSVSSVFSDVSYRASTLFAKRSFLHHYTVSGAVEEGDMAEAIENLHALERDYEEAGAFVEGGSDEDGDQY